ERTRAAGRTFASRPYSCALGPRFAMLQWLLLSAALSVGQISPPGPSVAAPSQTPAARAPDRWILMKALQGTAPGALLDSERMQVTGWIEGSFTASSVDNNNLPMGFNYRVNKFAVQQNWLRIDRAVVTSGTTEPTFGFRSDTILPGIDYRFT